MVIGGEDLIAMVEMKQSILVARKTILQSKKNFGELLRTKTHFWISKLNETKSRSFI